MLEHNVLYNGDCLEVMKEIEDKSISLILCDLPYGVTARNKWDTIIPFDKLWEQYERIIKDNGAIVLTSQQPFTTSLIMSNPKLFRYTLVWHKTTPTGFLNANKMPLRSHEDIVVFYKKLPTYNPQKTKGHKRKVSKAEHKTNSKMSTNYGEYEYTTYDSTERYPTSVLTFSTDKQKSAIHPTQKPLGLWEWIISSYSNKNDLVLDNCSGSCTTAVACDNLERRWICIEKEDNYCVAGKNRIDKNREDLNLPFIKIVKK